MIKVQSKDKRSPYSIEIVYEPRSEHAKQLNEYKKMVSIIMFHQKHLGNVRYTYWRYK